jgi:hypothetical protein
MQTERVTFLTTPEAKAALTARASARGLSTGEYIRQKVEEDDELTREQEAELAMLIEQVNASVPEMQASIERMIENLRQTHERVERTMAQMSTRR